MANTLSKLDRQAVGRSAQLLGDLWAVGETRRVKHVDRDGAGLLLPDQELERSRSA
jgi:hypothetical protein